MHGRDLVALSLLILASLSAFPILEVDRSPEAGGGSFLVDAEPILTHTDVAVAGSRRDPDSVSANGAVGESPRPAEASPAGGPRGAKWNVTITNKESAQDYPRSVAGGLEYAMNVSLRVEVPANRVGELRLALDTLFCFPLGCGGRHVVFSPLDSVAVDLGSGTHVLNYSIHAATPVVYRDSYAEVSPLAVLRFGSEDVSRDEYSYVVGVWPAERAVDVVLRGRVISWYGSEVFAGQVAVEEVIADPSGAIAPGKRVTVGVEGPWPEDIVEGDAVEIRGDYHPAEDPFVLVWKASHSVLPIEPRAGDGNGVERVLLAVSLVGGLAAGIVAYVYRTRRRARITQRSADEPPREAVAPEDGNRRRE